MERGYLSRQHYFFMTLAVLIFMASVAVFIVCFDLRYRSNGAAIVAAWAGIAVTMFVPIWAAIFLPLMAARKVSQRVNYPRIEHLRIAGKYAPTNAAKLGVSPLHLP